jgi:hypothetical protein
MAYAGLASTDELLRLVALGSSSNPRLTRLMLQAFCTGKADDSTLLQVEAREGTEFPAGFENAPKVAKVLHSIMYSKNKSLWDAAGVNPEADTKVVIAKKLARYVDGEGRTWSQLMVPLTMKEATDTWMDVHKYGGVALPDEADIGIAELATNNFIRIIDDSVYPVCAMVVVVDHALPASYVADPHLRPFTEPGDSRDTAERRRARARAEAERAQKAAEEAKAAEKARAEEAKKAAEEAKKAEEARAEKA